MFLLVRFYMESWLLALLVLSRTEFLETTILSAASLLKSSSSPEGLILGSQNFVANDRYYEEESQKVRNQVHQLVLADPAMAGALLRLAFHDATTRDHHHARTPNGSIQYELDRSENRGLSKPWSDVQDVQTSLSVADKIALAGAQAVESIGGPKIPIRLGRVDAKTADPEYLKHPISKSTERALVTKTLPTAALDSDGLRLYFGQLGLTEAEWVALTGGSHGLGRHVSLLGMPKECLKNLTRECLENAPVLLPFVSDGVNRFDTSYFQALLEWNEKNVQPGQVAFIPTDAAMVVDAGLRSHVQRFARDDPYFRGTFSRAYQKLVEVTATTKERF